MRTAAVEIEIVRTFSALEARREAWNRLVERAQTNTVFQTYECHASWWKAFGSGSKLFVVLARAGQELVGIAPLMITERLILGRRYRVVQFVGTRSFDYADFIVDRDRPDVLPLLIGNVLERLPRYNLLYLRDIPGASSTLGELRAFLKTRRVPSDIRMLYEAPTRLFNNPPEDRALPKKKSLKRHHRYFEKAGRLEFRNCATAEEAVPYLDVFFEQHIARRSATDTPSAFHDLRARTFLRELTQTLSPKGWLLFSILLFNDRPVAMHFGFEYGGRIIWYKPAFDISYADHSPGEVLMKYLLEYALERNVAEFDFTIGAEPYKYRYANHIRANYAVRAFSQWPEYHVTRAMLNARRFVERFPAASRVARKVLGRWREQPWL
jgi:CelD/BcsL family acetyltransferase involved in cellulose biosynthesis